jgi:hypothetical protein
LLRTQKVYSELLVACGYGDNSAPVAIIEIEEIAKKPCQVLSSGFS